MYPIEKYGLIHGDEIRITSNLCALAHIRAITTTNKDINNACYDLVQSYFNQWRFTVESYRKLYGFFLKLNAADDTERDSLFTEYDHVGIDLEPDFQSYSYLFIVSLKSLVDIFACVLDIVQNQIPRKEEDMPDFFNYLRVKYNRSDKANFLIPNDIPALRNEMNRLRDKNNRSWLHQAKELRDNIVHRGYLLRPEGNFRKQDKLMIVLDKGSNFNNSSGQSFDIGSLFEDFMTNMHSIDHELSDILVNNLTDLALYKNAIAEYKYEGFASQLTFTNE